MVEQVGMIEIGHEPQGEEAKLQEIIRKSSFPKVLQEALQTLDNKFNPWPGKQGGVELFVGSFPRIDRRYRSEKKPALIRLQRYLSGGFEIEMLPLNYVFADPEIERYHLSTFKIRDMVYFKYDHTYFDRHGDKEVSVKKRASAVRNPVGVLKSDLMQLAADIPTWKPLQTI